MGKTCRSHDRGLETLIRAPGTRTFSTGLADSEATTVHAAPRTVAELNVIEGAERIDELARMLAGDRVTETTRRQARELLGATP